ncbi:MAG TPA: helix-turn-helix domain-containing protein [Rhodocyclaceae bacterium]|nr:helix-turn-helix domain-containing protein [Rhodocyclaceae bacterium]HMV63698.1 helix-turn-helix domain-containing protein [Rhodocyclaceae bacterium]HMZ75882.1 helix-turn-helix domain-containing protein [Rhodocyclaceae bacterium]HNA67728.1 helix-turn-helix domain-containing protein [Rhodocyclaceae bacterium]HND23609.1 helix-turn-helix domain-containing protein [Rhodocyclaceae bacterium]
MTAAPPSPAESAAPMHSRSERRAHLVDTALRLFARGGYHATGIDAVLAASGVAKKTLYHHFPSKDDLIVEVLRERDRRFRASLAAFVAARATPRARLAAVFEWHALWFAEPDFAGCMFLNAAAEFHDGSAGILAVAREHKQALEAWLAALLTDLVEAERAAPLAADLNLLLDGAIGTALVSRDPAAAARAWALAERLLPAA